MQNDVYKDLTISIGTLGNHEVLARCLRTVFMEDDPDLDYEVCVIFNGHDLRPVADMLTREFPKARLIQRTGPLGQAGGRFELFVSFGQRL